MSAVSPLPTTVERQRFTEAMRQVAASVTVVTTDGSAGRHGATVTAFSSLSADPPSVLVCLHKDSRIAQAVQSNQVFCVNILPESAEALSQRFAGADDKTVSDRFTDIEIQIGANGVPQLSGALALHCQLTDSQHYASHQVFFGLVTQIEAATPRPLIYHNGAYAQLADKLS